MNGFFVPNALQSCVAAPSVSATCVIPLCSSSSHLARSFSSILNAFLPILQRVRHLQRRQGGDLGAHDFLELAVPAHRAVLCTLDQLLPPGPDAATSDQVPRNTRCVSQANPESTVCLRTPDPSTRNLTLWRTVLCATHHATEHRRTRPSSDVIVTAIVYPDSCIPSSSPRGPLQRRHSQIRATSPAPAGQESRSP